MNAVAPEPSGAGVVLMRTATGAGWIVGWRVATRVIGLVNTLILTRLLAPADFGLLALGSSLAIAVDTLSALGIEDALVREKDAGRAIYDTGFTLNLVRAGLTGTLLAAAAFPLAEFFKTPQLAYVVLSLALGSVIAGFGNIGTVDFRRHLAFNLEFKLLVVPRLASVVATLAVALVVRSYWALIAGILTGRVLGVMFSYVMHPYRPRLTLVAWRRLAGFSGWSWALSIAALIRDRTDSFFIGWSLNPAQVGVYSIGTEIADLPTTEVVGPLARACFSGFAAGRHAGEDAGEIYLRVIGAVTLLTFPAAVGISLLADPLIRLGFGAKWVEAIPIVQLTALFCATTVFGQISTSLFSAHAMLKSMVAITLAIMFLRVALLVLLVPQFGIIGAVLAAGVAMLSEYSTYVSIACRQFRLRIADVVNRVWRPIGAAGVMAACLHSLGLGWVATSGSPGSLVLQLIVCALAGAAVYSIMLAALWVMSGRPVGAETDCLALARRIIRRRLPVQTVASAE